MLRLVPPWVFQVVHLPALKGEDWRKACRKVALIILGSPENEEARAEQGA